LKVIALASTFLGLLMNLIGVWILYRYSRKINISYFDLQNKKYLAYIVDWGLGFVVVGTALQVIGALLNFW
jgi:uncharacterized membrane protein